MLPGSIVIGVAYTNRTGATTRRAVAFVKRAVYGGRQVDDMVCYDVESGSGHDQVFHQGEPAGRAYCTLMAFEAWARRQVD
jgi:hypothetical protein